MLTAVNVQAMIAAISSSSCSWVRGPAILNSSDEETMEVLESDEEEEDDDRS